MIIKFKNFILENSKSPYDLEIDESDEDYILYKLYFGRDIYGSARIEICFSSQYELEHIFTEKQYQKKFGETDSKLVKIEDLRTDSDVQQEGIGTYLMEQILKDIKNRGFNKIYLNACPIGTIRNKIPLNKLISFYKKFGFKEIKKDVRNCEMLLIILK